MRDKETTAISISASETGHLVFSTMNTSSASRTVARIVDFYPISQQSQVQTMVAESLRGVITQQLVPRKDGRGVVLAVELLVNISGVAQQIKEGKTYLISSLIQSGKKYGMVLMDESLMTMLNAETISGREAYKRAANKIQFEAVKNND
jgi:twitching motility protein PilT